MCIISRFTFDTWKHFDSKFALFSNMLYALKEEQGWTANLFHLPATQPFGLKEKKEKEKKTWSYDRVCARQCSGLKKGKLKRITK